MEKPIFCPPEVYELMLMCWNLDPPKRPTFQRICQHLDHLRCTTIQPHGDWSSEKTRLVIKTEHQDSSDIEPCAPLVYQNTHGLSSSKTKLLSPRSDHAGGGGGTTGIYQDWD
eukprot:TRINITY_DN1472_c0_g1_i1.p2 TRINITY_DN1472_c0_g1~~TRINITY_DN1472_c0_g1_i1.p2  ORF type:complete len:113 (+),score=26.43 TRINITY_DN1472_c0_g1_i1:156-494(+)